MPRYAAKVDANQPKIVEELRKFASVEINHDDILVGYKGINYWYEIKNVDGRNRKQDGQKKLEEEYKGHYKIVSSLEEILEDMGL